MIGEDVLVCDTAVPKTGKTIKPTLDILWVETGKKVSAKEFVFTCTENREIKDPAVYTVSAAPKNGNPNFTIAEGVEHEASLIVTEKTNLLSKAKVTVRGLGNYGGLRTLTFRITGKKADWFGNTMRLLRDLREGR